MNEQEQHKQDKQFLIECLTDSLIQMLMEDHDYDIPTAMHTLYTSDTYRKLENERTGLYYQSAVYLYDMLNEELEKQSSQNDQLG